MKVVVGEFVDGFVNVRYYWGSFWCGLLLKLLGECGIFLVLVSGFSVCKVGVDGVVG